MSRQSYDNAANMAGRYNGMQQKILEINKFAKLIPFTGHSLNLVGRSAVNCCLDAVNCFGIINKIYTFFSSSTKIWEVLKSFLQPQSIFHNTPLFKQYFYIQLMYNSILYIVL